MRDLPLPPALIDLIDSGVWPTSATAASQNLTPVAAPEDVERVAPGERALFLEPPPFRTLAEEIADNPGFWDEHGVLGDIDPDRALVIGDFGPGSDAVLVLDYRTSADDPTVVRLAWTDVGTRWVEVAPTVDDLVRRLGLR